MVQFFILKCIISSTLEYSRKSHPLDEVNMRIDGTRERESDSHSSMHAMKYIYIYILFFNFASFNTCARGIIKCIHKRLCLSFHFKSTQWQFFSPASAKVGDIARATHTHRESRSWAAKSYPSGVKCASAKNVRHWFLFNFQILSHLRWCTERMCADECKVRQRLALEEMEREKQWTLTYEIKWYGCLTRYKQITVRRLTRDHS